MISRIGVFYTHENLQRFFPDCDDISVDVLIRGN